MIVSSILFLILFNHHHDTITGIHFTWNPPQQISLLPPSSSTIISNHHFNIRQSTNPSTSITKRKHYAFIQSIPRGGSSNTPNSEEKQEEDQMEQNRSSNIVEDGSTSNTENVNNENSFTTSDEEEENEDTTIMNVMTSIETTEYEQQEAATAVSAVTAATDSTDSYYQQVFNEDDSSSNHDEEDDRHHHQVLLDQDEDDENEGLLNEQYSEDLTYDDLISSNDINVDGLASSSLSSSYHDNSPSSSINAEMTSLYVEQTIDHGSNNDDSDDELLEPQSSIVDSTTTMEYADPGEILHPDGIVMDDTASSPSSFDDPPPTIPTTYDVEDGDIEYSLDPPSAFGMEYHLSDQEESNIGIDTDDTINKYDDDTGISIADEEIQQQSHEDADMDVTLEEFTLDTNAGVGVDQEEIMMVEETTRDSYTWHEETARDGEDASVEMETVNINSVQIDNEEENIETTTPEMNPETSINDDDDAIDEDETIDYYPSGSEDSTAFVDRMDLADAYDDDDNADSISTGEVEESLILSEVSQEITDSVLELDDGAVSGSDSGSNSQTDNARTVQYVITKNMRRVLIRELGYSSAEVHGMKPDVAAVLVSKMLKRPKVGMPTEFYVEGMAPAVSTSRKLRWSGIVNLKIMGTRIVVPLAVMLATALGGVVIGESSSLLLRKPSSETKEEEDVVKLSGEESETPISESLTIHPSTPSSLSTPKSKVSTDLPKKDKKKKLKTRQSIKPSLQATKDDDIPDENLLKGMRIGDASGLYPPKDGQEDARTNSQTDPSEENVEDQILLQNLLEQRLAEGKLGKSMDKNWFDRAVSFTLEKVDDIFKRPF